GGANVSVTTRVLHLPTVAAVDEAAGQRRAEVLAAFRKEAGGDPNWRPSPAEVQAAVAAAREVQRTMTLEQPAQQASGGAAVAGEEAEGWPASVGTQGGLTPLLHAIREGH